MNNNIKVSIITVCYNSQNTIEKTIQSVLHQTYKNIEYIIIDGKSGDRTIEIIREYENLFEGKLKYLSEDDNGIYDAMNKGIALATGELIGIINSDDYYENNAVSSVVGALTDDIYQILYGAVRAVKLGKEERIQLLSHQFLHERMIGHPACFVTKSIYDDFGVFNLAYECVADYDFMLRMSKRSEVIFKPVYELLANFTIGGICSSNKAYLELLLLQKNWGIISKYKYVISVTKHRICSFACKIKSGVST